MENPIVIYIYTYILKPITTQLCKKLKKTNDSKPSTPQHRLIHLLHVQNTKYEDKLIENKIPEFVFDVLNKQKKNQFFDSLDTIKYLTTTNSRWF